MESLLTPKAAALPQTRDLSAYSLPRLSQAAPHAEDPYERIVITGVGPVAPSGIGSEAFWRGQNEMRSFVSEWPIPAFQELPGKRTALAAGVLSRPIHQELVELGITDSVEAQKLGHMQSFALAAVHLALQDAALSAPALNDYYPPETRALLIGSSVAPRRDLLRFLERKQHDPLAPMPGQFFPATMSLGLTAESIRRFNFRNDSRSVSSASDAGLSAIVQGVKMMLQDRSVDLAVAGGIEEGDDPERPVYWHVLRELGLLSSWEGPVKDASRVATKDRSGIIPGEGAGAVVLERLSKVRKQGRTDRILAEITGFSSNLQPTDYDPMTPDATGESACRSIQEAICGAARHGRLRSAASLVVYPHFNGSPGDLAVAKGIKSALGAWLKEMLITSAVTHNGYGFAAMGAWNTILAALSLREHRLSPMLHITPENQDKKRFPFQFVTEARKAAPDAAVVHSHGFYNAHASVVLEPVK